MSLSPLLPHHPAVALDPIAMQIVPHAQAVRAHAQVTGQVGQGQGALHPEGAQGLGQGRVGEVGGNHQRLAGPQAGAPVARVEGQQHVHAGVVALGQALQRLALQHHMHDQLIAGAKGRLGQRAGGRLRQGGQQGKGGRGLDHRVSGQRGEGCGGVGGGDERRLHRGRRRLRGQRLVRARGAVEQGRRRSTEQGQPAGGDGEPAQQSAQRGFSAGGFAGGEGAGGRPALKAQLELLGGHPARGLAVMAVVGHLGGQRVGGGVILQPEMRAHF